MVLLDSMTSQFTLKVTRLACKMILYDIVTELLSNLGRYCCSKLHFNGHLIVKYSSSLRLLINPC